jgi:hypothetical protein
MVNRISFIDYIDHCGVPLNKFKDIEIYLSSFVNIVHTLNIHIRVLAIYVLMHGDVWILRVRYSTYIEYTLNIHTRAL